MIPSSLQNMLDVALQQVQADPRHILSPLHRAAVYAHFGPISTPQGWKRRATVALLAAQRALPIWQQWRDHYHPHDDRLERLLLSAERILSDAPDVDTEAVRSGALAAWWWVMNDDVGRDEDIPPRPVSSAFTATARALFVVLGNDEWPDDDTGLVEIVIDPWNADAALWADGAVSGSGVWPESVEIAEHLAFWTWWLTTAVPTAWGAAT